MAGQIKVDSINADSNLALKIANTAVAFIDSSGLRPVSGNVSLDATATSKFYLPSANTVEIQTAGVTGLSMSSSQVVTLANALPVGSGGTGATSLSGITVGTATTATSATTATNLAGGSNGTIPYQSASGTTQMLAAGSSGQLLQSNGAAAPTWVAPPGNYTLLTSGSITNGTTNLDLETGFTDATYPEIVIVLSNLKSASTQGYFTSRFKIGGSYNTSANYGISKFAAGETVQNLTSQTEMLMGFAQIASAGTGTDAVFIVKNRFQRQTGSGVMTCLAPRKDNDNQIGMWWGYISASGDIQGVRFFITSSTANFGSGTYAVYGFKYV